MYLLHLLLFKALISLIIIIAIGRPRVMKRKGRLEAQAGSRVHSRMFRRELERLKAPVVRRRRHKRGCKVRGRSGDEIEVDRNLLENQVESKLI